MKANKGLKKFFYPPPGSPRWMFILPILVAVVFISLLFLGGNYGWEYTNSPKFCGTTCHTMPPQNEAYLVSPHANVYCSECHIGRASVRQQLARKSQDVRELYAMVFNTYEFPIRAAHSRPARETCEQCHLPETFSDDSLRVITHFNEDIENTPTSTYLILKTGGGAKRAGLGRGIHWHIVNKVYYYSDDIEDQVIPYVKVVNEDGSFTEYVEVESEFDPASINEEQLVEMDCLTCHNRVSHSFQYPQDSVDSAMARGVISPEIPEIRKRAVKVLSTSYVSHAQAMVAVDALENYYTEHYPEHQEQVSTAVTAIKEIYDRTVFIDQKVNWTTHPDNIGHINSPGCFRCHDGAHLDTQNHAIRLECNACHSIPVVAGDQDFVANIEISRGPEPASHLNSNWISLHNQAFDQTCSNCHTTEDPGGTSNISFCSNSACHGNVFPYAGFDAPGLREILKDQLPDQQTDEPLPPVAGTPTFDNSIGPIFGAKCIACHGKTASAGLDLSSYKTALSGSESGPVIEPGNSTGSILVQVQRGDHFATLTTDELNLVIQWIDAGAPEN
ncbi:MAG: NapC/NirT family cytochrome c [Anaerolineales bacterium]|nr:NapC/NirT family cytochrome c [Anaerolineales bacterium]